jgi:hypothetical protein
MVRSPSQDKRDLGLAVKKDEAKISLLFSQSSADNVANLDVPLRNELKNMTRTTAADEMAFADRETRLSPAAQNRSTTANRSGQHSTFNISVHTSWDNHIHRAVEEYSTKLVLAQTQHG